MLDHIGLQVHSYERSKAFYQEALAPLGYQLILEYADWGGFGIGGKPDFWIQVGKQVRPGLHIAFRADNREMVDAFYRAALDAGGKDNGPPGLREIYHPDYYGAFVMDPDGHNIEAVCHTPVQS
ncbi:MULTISPECIES: VOC family protein [unclassified Microbulbifer]|uniref:VOC family protein n=1 Tax=unclassified Microbulbifer TaxID=2619833 RepID=UPI0027E56018|nr:MULTISPECIES: VOC family protein [unclassified Microbulbifer]